MPCAALPARSLRLLPAAFACALASTAVPAQEAPSRGRLLYDNHCVSCHSAQVHWRDGNAVSDWSGLVEQVRVWQARAFLNWSDPDIHEVARFLNDAVYKLPAPRGRG